MDLMKEINEAVSRVPEVVQDLKGKFNKKNLADKTPEEKMDLVGDAVKKHYAAIKWSVEKEEWDKLNPKQKDVVVKSIINYLERK